MAKTDNLTDFLTDVANAIRTKKGITDLINPQNFSDEILSIVSTAGDVKFEALVDGSIKTLSEEDIIDIPEIRPYAFYNCTNLTSAVIPSNITSIGVSAFEGCSSLQTLVLNDGVQTIGTRAFKDINVSEINIPSTLSILETEVFANNTELTSITIPSNITQIKDYAFNGCTNLTEITMGNATPIAVTENTFPANVTAIYVEYSAYDAYVADWTAYADKIVRLPAIPSTIIVTINNYLDELVSGANVTITGNEQTFTGTTNEQGVFTQGDLQPATYTISVSDLDGFKTPSASEVVVEENTTNNVVMTYLEKPAVSRVFGENTPEQISVVSTDISANNMTSTEVFNAYGWSIGDTINIPLKDNTTMQMRIIGFNHDNLSDGTGKAGITLEMTHCFSTLYPMNSSSISSSTNRGGYPASYIKTSVLPTLKNNIPDEWLGVIKLVDKKSADGGSSNYNDVVTLSEDIFLLCENEVIGTFKNAQDAYYEGDWYEYYENNNNNDARIKKYDADGDGIYETEAIWWLRSSAQNSSKSFCVISVNGASGISTGKSEARVSFAFCV